MPAPLNVDREAVRVLVVAIGPRAAARELGLPEATVQAWSARFGWLDGTKPTQALPRSMINTATVATVSPAEALSAVLADHERETRLDLAIAARRNALEAKEAGLAGASEALLTGKLAALVHGWKIDSGTTVNVAVALRLDME